MLRKRAFRASGLPGRRTAYPRRRRCRVSQRHVIAILGTIMVFATIGSMRYARLNVEKSQVTMDQEDLDHLVASKLITTSALVVKSDEAISQSDSTRKWKQIWMDPASSECERFFGNGYSEKFFPCDPSISCWRNPTVTATVCTARDIVLDPQRIRVSGGGEKIEDVAGRNEDDEYCRYTSGAFSAQCTLHSDLITDATLPHHMKDVMQSVNPSDFVECEEWIEKPTLAVTRYEYANLYHTFTDWYNVYQTQRMLGFDSVDIMFLDGHSVGSIDEAWPRLFGSTPIFVGKLKAKQCYRNLAFVSPGYRSTLSIGPMSSTPQSIQCRNSPQIQDFREHFLRSFGLDDTQMSAPNDDVVLFVFRRDYLAHPRMGKRPISRKIRNEKELISHALQQMPNAVIRDVSFETMTMTEQIQAVHSAKVIVGVHGAGLSYALLAKPNSGVIELAPPSYTGRQHFRFFAAFAGLEYTTVAIGPEGLNGNHDVDVQRVVSAAKDMLNTIKSRENKS